MKWNWKMGMKSFKDLFAAIEKVPAKSLQLTREVLKERENLELAIQGLQQLTNNGLSKLEEVKKEALVIKQYEMELEANKDFTYTITVTKQRKVNTGEKQYVTNCLVCNFTCHISCIYPNDKEKINCSAMGLNHYCTVCSGRCYWEKHVNNPYFFEFYEEHETRTSEDLKAKYEGTSEQLSKQEQMIENLNRQLDEIEEGVIAAISQARKSLERLSEIAARPYPMSTVDYIDLLIESEKKSAKPGWPERVSHLYTAKKKAEVIKDVNDENFDPWLNFKTFTEKRNQGENKWWKFW